MAGALPEVPVTMIYKSVMPFIAADVVILAILMAFPWLSLVLLKYM
jgi:TRAP-type C4-dicarboxylate transport system permease large subunit